MLPGSLWPLGCPRSSGHHVVPGYLVSGLANQMAHQLGDQMAGGPGQLRFLSTLWFSKQASGERVWASLGLSLLVSPCPRKVEGTCPKAAPGAHSMVKAVTTQGRVAADRKGLLCSPTTFRTRAVLALHEALSNTLLTGCRAGRGAQESSKSPEQGPYQTAVLQLRT
ncbi:hypothetical protein NDU88_006951 [Pleurodeles waltl]|uniref:Uncharacterized protein n=1 Tax=Pleurodeles waltl TaxID=8319 RepID=A0AAV7UN11_PLEWA|nr:hypothetical protein NDU88_006951 [Pleurodeles waltl]